MLDSYWYNRDVNYPILIHNVFSFVRKFPRITRSSGYVGLDPTKNCTPSGVLEAGEPGVPSEGNPWNRLKTPVKNVKIA